MENQNLPFTSSAKSKWLKKNKRNLFLLLMVASQRARWKDSLKKDGLIAGDAILGQSAWEEAGLTRMQYRDALTDGVKLGVWEIVWNPKNKTHQKRTLKRTIKCMVVNISKSGIWNVDETVSEPSKNAKEPSKIYPINSVDLSEPLKEPSHKKEPSEEPLKEPSGIHLNNSYNSMKTNDICGCQIKENDEMDEKRTISQKRTIKSWFLDQENNNHETPLIMYFGGQKYIKVTQKEPPEKNHERSLSLSLEQKETNKEKVSDFRSNSRSFFSNQEKEEALEALKAYCSVYDIQIPEKDFQIWLKKYPKDTILSNLSMMIHKQKTPIKEPVRWLQTALYRDYAGKESAIQSNRSFAEQFKKSHKWNDLVITEQYCRDDVTGNDYQFNLSPNQFQAMLTSRYRTNVEAFAR